MTNWNREQFSYWLKLQRRVEHPMSQEHLAELLGDDVTQSKISRWEKATENTDAPTLDQCLHLADIFEADFIDLARMCGRWNDELEERVRVALTPANGDPADQKGALANAHNPRYVETSTRTNVVSLPARAAQVCADIQVSRDSDRIAA